MSSGSNIGLSKRDFFVAAALTGILSNPNLAGSFASHNCQFVIKDPKDIDNLVHLSLSIGTKMAEQTE